LNISFLKGREVMDWFLIGFVSIGREFGGRGQETN